MPALAESLAFASNPSWGTRTHSSRSSWVSTAAFQPLMGNKNPRIDPQADRITHDAGRPGEQRGRPFGCRDFQPLMGNTNPTSDTTTGDKRAFQPTIGHKNDRHTPTTHNHTPHHPTYPHTQPTRDQKTKHQPT